MKVWAALVMALLGGTVAIAARSASGEESADGPSRGLGKLGWELVRRAGDGNVVLSPLSVWEALAMTYTGAGGVTAAQIAAVLGMPNDADAITSASERLRETLSEARGKDIALDVANRLWVQRGKALDAAFTKRLDTSFAAPAGVVDFSGDTEKARVEINRWVGDHTAQKIDELLKPGVLDSLTRIVLTNAIYMKAPWATAFDAAATRDDSFLLAEGKPIQVPFMHRTAYMRAGTGDGAKVVELPYAGDRLAMIIAVPDAPDGAGALIAKLGEDWHARWSGALERRRVALALPRFTARKALALDKALQALGMVDAFSSSTADFSGMDGTRELFVSAVVHEGFVDVTEQGTEAAAATGVVVGVRSALPEQEEPFVVEADRPFVWAIVERSSGALLFAGVVRDPRAG